MRVGLVGAAVDVAELPVAAVREVEGPGAGARRPELRVHRGVFHEGRAAAVAEHLADEERLVVPADRPFPFQIDRAGVAAAVSDVLPLMVITSALSAGS